MSGEAITAPVTKFQKIWVDDGLPDRTIWSLAQDSQGLIWMGTSKGLASYDGYQFTHYKNTNNSRNSIVGNVVRALHIDEDDNIWSGTRSGLSRFNKKTALFRNYTASHFSDNRISSLLIYSIEKSDSNTLWLGTSTGLFKFNTKTERLSKITFQLAPINTHSSFRVNDLLVSNHGELLVATTIGLFQLDKNSQHLQPVIIENTYEYNINVKSLYQLSSGDILAGTNQGLYTLNTRNDKLVKYSSNLENLFIYSIVEDNKNNIWLGTLDNGLYKLDKNGSISKFEYDKTNENSLSDNDIYSLLVDRSGVLWVGTFNGGLNYTVPMALQFKFYDDSKTSLPCLKTPVVYSVLKQDNNLVWLGTQQGLAKVNLKSKSCLLFSKDSSNGFRLLANEIASLHLDKKNDLWIGTSKGVNLLTNNQSKVIALQNGLPKASAYSYLDDLDGNMWVTSFKGLYVRKNQEEVFQQVSTLDKTLENSIIFDIKQDSTKNIFLAARNGLLTVNKNFQIARVKFKTNIDLTKPIRAIHIDAKNHLWVGIDNYGLFKFDSQGNLQEQYTDSSTLRAIDGFMAILEQPNGDLWISSSSGISRLNLVTKQIKIFDNSDGLQSNIFSRGAAFKDKQGNFLFGGRKGLNIFNPETIQTNTIEPQILLTKFLYFNRPFSINHSDDGFKLEQTISYTQQLELSHKDSLFGFEFSAIHFEAPQRNQYQYMLQGQDKNWTTTDANYRRVTYNNLQPGNYNFRVKASNNHGVWTRDEINLQIKVLPPPWLTPSAFVLYIVVFILSLVSFINYRTRTLKGRAQKLEQSVVKRTQELATEKNKVEQLLSRKNEEFANVSHEFRTPLTLILGPLAQALKFTQDKPEVTSRLSIVQRNGYRLLRMVDQLLNIETFRVKSITQKSPQASGRIIRQLGESFLDLAKEKGIQLQIKEIADINFEFTPDALEKIILNLLSNAVKYTKPGGEITLSSQRTTDNELLINITDTGIGIPANKIDSVFERYNRVLDENSEQVTGAGIGLALVKNLVESHQGHVAIDSQLGQGTSINIRLPIVGEVSANQVSSQSNDELIAIELMSLTNQSAGALPETNPHSHFLESTKPCVLVIEDNNDMRTYIAESICSEYQIITAKDGEEGVQLAIEEVPDLIISDVMMPKKDGYQTVQELRNNPITNHIPIVLLTARGDRESRLKGWYEKADEYLTKPFDTEELRVRLNNLLEIRDILKKRFGEIAFQQSAQPQAISQPGSGKSAQQEKFIAQLNTAIESLFKDSKTSVADIASAVAMSERQLFRKLKSTLDMSPKEYLRRFRMEKARQLLQQGETTTNTAFEVGYSSQSYFSQSFKAQFGCSPSQYNNQF